MKHKWENVSRSSRIIKAYTGTLISAVDLCEKCGCVRISHSIQVKGYTTYIKDGERFGSAPACKEEEESAGEAPNFAAFLNDCISSGKVVRADHQVKVTHDQEIAIEEILMRNIDARARRKIRKLLNT